MTAQLTKRPDNPRLNVQAPGLTGRSGPLRVLHVISGRMFGGGQRVVQDLVRTLPTLADLEVRLCLLGRQGDFFAEFAPTVVAYDGNYRNPLSAWRTARRLRRVLRTLAPDIVHTHGYDAELIGALAVGRLPVRHISHIHDTPGWIASQHLRHRVRRGLTRIMLRRSRTSWIACAEAVRQYVCAHLGWPPEAVRTVRNGIDVERFSVGASPAPPRPPDGALVVGTAARLAWNKGIEDAIRAVALLQRDGFSARLRIAGDGELKDRLVALSHSVGIAPHVEFLGLVSDMRSFYRGLDVFVLPSLSEGLPLTVLEAMAMGLPVVATTVMGTVEVIRDGVDGLLVSPKDVEGLHVALAGLAQSAELRLTLGRKARERALAEFGLERVGREVLTAYRHSLCVPRRRP